MTLIQSLSAFTLAATLLTLTPGLDTALVLRTAASEGPKRATLAGAGVLMGCLAWGAAAAVGLGALLAASTLAFTVLKWAGAAYLVWMGIGLILKPRDRFEADAAAAATGGGWLWRGLFTNLLNPKVGVFYVSFLPQFLVEGVPAGPYMFGLAAIHAALGAIWFAALIAATQPISRALRRPAVVRWMDRATGAVFIGFGLKLALARR